MHGLEINPYAQQLAQVVIWIGYLQWMHYNGFKMPDHPVLAPIESIRCMDAILDLSDPEHPKEPEWPEAEFIVGNPPFLGITECRQGLADDYVDRLWQVCSTGGQRDLPTFAATGLKRLVIGSPAARHGGPGSGNDRSSRRCQPEGSQTDQ